MATFRGSNHQIGASSVWTNGDLTNIIENLYRQSIRTGASGDYARGLRDMAQSIADATNTEINLAPPAWQEHITERYERIEERFERTVERYAPPPAPPTERQFKIVGQREEQAPMLAETDVDFDDFVPGAGHMRRMDMGWMWLGNDGQRRFYPVQQWVELTADDARSLGFLIATNRQFILAVRSRLEERQRRQLTAQPAARIMNDRRLLR